MSNELVVPSLQAIQSQEKVFLYDCRELLTILQLKMVCIPDTYAFSVTLTPFITRDK
jgi:hypothetical protein